MKKTQAVRLVETSAPPTAKITTAQLRQVIEHALAAAELVRALVRTTGLHHANEQFISGALMMVDGPLSLIVLGKADGEEANRLEMEISRIRMVISEAMELVTIPDAGLHLPVEILTGVLAMVETMLRAAGATPSASTATNQEVGYAQ